MALGCWDALGMDAGGGGAAVWLSKATAAGCLTVGGWAGGGLGCPTSACAALGDGIATVGAAEGVTSAFRGTRTSGFGWISIFAGLGSKAVEGAAAGAATALVGAVAFWALGGCTSSFVKAGRGTFNGTAATAVFGVEGDAKADCGVGAGCTAPDDGAVAKGGC